MTIFRRPRPRWNGAYLTTQHKVPENGMQSARAEPAEEARRLRGVRLRVVPTRQVRRRRRVPLQPPRGRSVRRLQRVHALREAHRKRSTRTAKSGGASVVAARRARSGPRTAHVQIESTSSPTSSSTSSSTFRRRVPAERLFPTSTSRRPARASKPSTTSKQGGCNGQRNGLGHDGDGR